MSFCAGSQRLGWIFFPAVEDVDLYLHKPFNIPPYKCVWFTIFLWNHLEHLPGILLYGEMNSLPCVHFITRWLMLLSFPSKSTLPFAHKEQLLILGVVCFPNASLISLSLFFYCCSSHSVSLFLFNRKVDQPSSEHPVSILLLPSNLISFLTPRAPESKGKLLSLSCLQS